MAIELELPADMDATTTWTAEPEAATASTAAADQAVGLLEAETEPEAMEEGREIEGLDGETISIAPAESNSGSHVIRETLGGVTIAIDPPKPSPQEISQAAWKQRIRAISDELAEAALERLEAESRYKAAKNREKAIVEQLSEVMKEGPRVVPLFDRQPDQQPSGQAAADSVAPDAQTWAESGGHVVIEPLTDDAWRSVHIAELNLKPKLQERLEEAGCDTIGRLEDLRGEISQGREKWPKGIGKAKITEIEDALEAWFRKNRDAAVFAEAQAKAATTALETLADFTERSEEIAEFDPCARAVELDDDIENLDPRHPEGVGFWESGFQAYNQNAQVSECPYVAGPEADDWIRGWLSAGKDDGGSVTIKQQDQSVSLDDL